VDALIVDANHRGGLDNITAIVVRIDSLDYQRDDQITAAVALKQ
jgi:serine/threonine protein phosphatase PrpC